MPFRDYFSTQATQYSKHRPAYPEEFFAYLASLTPERELAWDCGTGNGQAALALAQHFQKVIATDASREQIENAFSHPNVHYRVEPAEATSIDANSVDLITVGTAVHWFDFEPFYAEVRRVGKAGAILAVWTYHFPVINPAVDEVLARLYWQTLDGFWPQRIRFLEERYETLPFPFDEIEPSDFHMQADWDLSDLAGFINSWSATQKYIQQTGDHPLDEVFDDLLLGWGSKEMQRTIRWPLYMRIGRLSESTTESTS
ncbi:MAG: class I SAM-dependent methyltransferase [Anaerolineales bacterium]|jgi:ubiquinone/menaquinone biosynthesis C-methylase UbiE